MVQAVEPPAGWEVQRNVESAYEGPPHVASMGKHWYLWKVNLPGGPGPYDVALFRPDAGAMSNAVEVIVYDGDTEVFHGTVDQSKNTGQWNTVFSGHTFTSSRVRVRITNKRHGRRVAVDGVALHYIDPAPVRAYPVEDAPDVAAERPEVQVR